MVHTSWKVGLRPCVPRDRIPSSKLAGVEQWLNERPISIESSSMAIITTKELLLSYLMLRPISGERGRTQLDKVPDRRSALSTSGNPAGHWTERTFQLKIEFCCRLAVYLQTINHLDNVGSSERGLIFGPNPL